MLQADSTFGPRSPKSILADVLALAVGGALVIILPRLDLPTPLRSRTGGTRSSFQFNRFFAFFRFFAFQDLSICVWVQICPTPGGLHSPDVHASISRAVAYVPVSEMKESRRKRILLVLSRAVCLARGSGQQGDRAGTVNAAGRYPLLHRWIRALR